MKFKLLSCVLALSWPVFALPLRVSRGIAQDQTDQSAQEQVQLLRDELMEQRSLTSPAQAELTTLQSELNAIHSGAEAIEHSRLRRLQLLEETRRTFENMQQTLQTGSKDLEAAFVMVRGNFDQIAQEAEQFAGLGEAEAEVKATALVAVAHAAVEREDLRQAEDALSLAVLQTQQARNFAGSGRAALP